MVLSFVSLAYLPVANASALAYLTPSITLPLASVMLGERLARRVVLACLLGFVGVLLMLQSSLQSPSGSRLELIGIAAGLGYAATMGFDALLFGVWPDLWGGTGVAVILIAALITVRVDLRPSTAAPARP